MGNIIEQRRSASDTLKVMESINDEARVSVSEDVQLVCIPKQGGTMICHTCWWSLEPSR
jgi:hypothetical protein